MLSKYFLKLNQFIALIAIAFVVLFIFINVSDRLVHINEEVNNTAKRNDEQYSLSIKYLIDKSNALSIEQISEKDSTFIPEKINNIPFELSNQTYWVEISIQNNSNQDLPLVLYADNSLLDVFNVYQKRGSEYLKSNIFQENENKLTKAYPHINVELPANKSSMLMVQLQTQGPPNIPLLVISEEKFSQRVLYAQIFYGAFIGIILLMAMYNLVLYFAIKDNVYLLYIGYLLSSFLVLSSLTGFGFLLFTTETQAIINRYLVFLHYYIIVFLLLFTLLFLRYNQRKSWVYSLSLFIACGLIICSFFSLTLDAISQAKLFFSIQPIVLLFALFIILKRVRTDFSWAKFYLLSWIPLLVGSAIQPLVLLNYLEYSFITSNAFLFAVMAEITLMAFALAERMKRNELDRLRDISYHITSRLPRKSNLERFINQLIVERKHQFSVVIIKPEHIEKVALYIDDVMMTELFQTLFSKLHALFQYNDKVFVLTDNNEKICFLNNNSLAIVVNSNDDDQTLAQLIASIQEIVYQNFIIKKLKLPLSAVIGVAQHPEHGTKSHQLINHAFLALNLAEKSQKKWAFFQKNPASENAELLELISDLQVAIERNELEVFHQPQIDLKTLRVCSSECLIRWHHPTKGFIPPAVFIPVAEDMGIINELTFWVVKKALQQQFILSDECGFNHMVSINISGKDIASKHFFPKILDIIEASSIPADKLIFELTESASFTHNEQSLSLIEKLVELGVTISIDDFGTGYSSMSQVSHLPFQELKVDREFVENVNDDEKRKIIAESTVKMAKGLGLEVVAEGINSQEDEDTLRSFGCDIGQGYFYAKPMAFDDYLSWLENLDNGRIKQPVNGEYIPAPK